VLAAAMVFQMDERLEHESGRVKGSKWEDESELWSDALWALLLAPEIGDGRASRSGVV
jgi:hypothetical protein